MIAQKKLHPASVFGAALIAVSLVSLPAFAKAQPQKVTYMCSKCKVESSKADKCAHCKEAFDKKGNCLKCGGHLVKKTKAAALK